MNISNISALWKLKGAWETFTTNHPKFPLFLDAMQRKGVTEGTVIGISFTDTEGKTIETNIKLTASDMELYETLKDLRQYNTQETLKGDINDMTGRKNGGVRENENMQ